VGEGREGEESDRVLKIHRRRNSRERERERERERVGLFGYIEIGKEGESSEEKSRKKQISRLR
jgi:hypothetical protein